MDINKATNILIIPLQSDDPSHWQASQALAFALTEKGKSVKYFANSTVRKFINSFIPDEGAVFDAESARDVVIKVSNFKDKANNLSWNQTGNSLELKIRTENGTLTNPVVEIERAGANFDIKIFVGMGRNKAEKDKEIKKLGLTRGDSIFLEQEADTDSPTSLVFHFLKNSNFPIPEICATLLLKSLYAYTEDFNKKVSFHTFELASELIKTGARLDSSPRSINKPQVDKVPPTEELIPLSDVLESFEKEADLEDNLPAPAHKPVEDTPQKAVEDKKDVVIPEELPQDFDPLAPATNMPEPIRLENKKVGIQPPGPLPSAH